MERIRHGLDITKEFLGYLKDFVEGDKFKDDLGKAGSIAAMIGLGLKLYQQVSEKAKTEDEKAFSSLIKFTFECAQATLSNNKDIPININSKQIKKRLFCIFIDTKQDTEDPYWTNYYLPSHPLVREFKKLFRELLEAERRRDLVQDFILDFDTNIEGKVDNFNNLIFKQWSDHMKSKKKLTEHLLYASTMIYQYNLIDNKYLKDYYVENNAVELNIYETWEREDAEFFDYINQDSEERKASIIVMKSVNKRIRYGGGDDNRFTIVAASFGIGKTSLAIYIASTCASQYLEGNDLFNDDSGDDSSGRYIPVFVALKDVNIDTQNHIERRLQYISPGQEAKKRNILLICDGLDEYKFEERDLKKALDSLSTEDKYPNIKFLITTRLEAGFQKLHTGLKNYIRLLPFNESQVNEFFTEYGTPQYSFKTISSYGLGDEEKRKPLFCWMIALNPNSERFLPQSVTSSINKSRSYLTMALLYQDFIHSLIRAKYRKAAEEFSEYYSEEKNLLRKIAALKQAYESIGDILTVNKLIVGLGDYYGLDYNTIASEERKNIFDPAMISYFYLSGKTTRDKTVDFIHKSFKEHLLAEYYIESMLDYNNRHYLNVGMPSDQTINHLTGLLEIVLNEDEHLRKQTDNFIISLKNQHDKTLKESLVENATKIFESEEIVIFQPNKKKDINRKNDGMGWDTIYTPAMKYRELWIHRWLSLYILNSLAPKNKIDKTILANFITNTSHTVPSSLKRLTNVDLSESDLSGADLHKANLSEGIFKGTDLSFTDLSGADISNACIIESDLSGADLVETNLTKSTLSKTNLSSTDLSFTDLSGAKLSLLLLRDVKILNLELDENTSFDNTLTNVPELVKFIETDERINPNISITPIGYNQISRGELKTGASQVKGIRQALIKELKTGGYDNSYIDEIFKLDPLWVISSHNGFCSL